MPIVKKQKSKVESMSRRDFFALAVLNGLISARSGPLNDAELEVYSADAWKMADKMLKNDGPTRPPRPGRGQQ
jgi:hypothetical protein